MAQRRRPKLVEDVLIAGNSPIVEALASHLWRKDLINLSSTCGRLRKLIGPLPRLGNPNEGYFRYILKCDGSGGKAWQELILICVWERMHPNIIRHFPFPRIVPDLPELRQTLRDAYSCQSQVVGGDPAQPCAICQLPVCITCKASGDYRSETSKPNNDARIRFRKSPEYALVEKNLHVQEEMAKELGFVQPKYLCMAHEMQALAEVPKDENGRSKECTCVHEPMLTKLWLCLPCFRAEHSRRLIAHRQRTCEKSGGPEASDCNGLGVSQGGGPTFPVINYIDGNKSDWPVTDMICSCCGYVRHARAIWKVESGELQFLRVLKWCLSSETGAFEPWKWDEMDNEACSAEFALYSD